MGGNAVIAQSGGPTAVINRTLISLTRSLENAPFGYVLGSKFGIKGVLNEDFFPLHRLLNSTNPKFEKISKMLDEVSETPGSALGSVRKKPTEEECEQILEKFKKLDVRYFFYIGGNDSAETACILDNYAKRAGYELSVCHIPKTIDNDLRVNDHTPGYGSAARYVALANIGLDYDNKSLPGVIINVVMGKNAGFLTAAAALGRRCEDDGPHLLYFPEREFEEDVFLRDIDEVYKKFGRAQIAVAEGVAKTIDGKKKTIAEIVAERHGKLQGLYQKLSKVNDTGSEEITKLIEEAKSIIADIIPGQEDRLQDDGFGKVTLSGTGMLADYLASLIKNKLRINRVRADTLGYLQRSFPTVVSEADADDAALVGDMALFYATKEGSGSVAIKRDSNLIYTPLETVARETKSMPDDFIAPSSNNVTDAFLKYASPLVGELPKTRTLTEVFQRMDKQGL
jgi:6-phosphofructokinase 1